MAQACHGEEQVSSFDILFTSFRLLFLPTASIAAIWENRDDADTADYMKKIDRWVVPFLLLVEYRRPNSQTKYSMHKVVLEAGSAAELEKAQKRLKDKNVMHKLWVRTKCLQR